MLAGVTLSWQLPGRFRTRQSRLRLAGPWHLNQLAVEWLALEAGIKLLHVPYRGGAAPVSHSREGRDDTKHLLRWGSSFDHFEPR